MEIEAKEGAPVSVTIPSPLQDQRQTLGPFDPKEDVKILDGIMEVLQNKHLEELPKPQLS